MILEKRIEKELPSLKRYIEKELDLSIGQIYVKPKKEFLTDYLEYIEEEKLYGKKEIMDKINEKSWFCSTDLPNNIYYTERTAKISLLFFGKEALLGNLLHELTHLAHLRIVGKEILEKTPTEIVEGFAEYIRTKITREKFGEITIPSDNPLYEKYEKNFEKEVKNKKLNNPSKIKDYLKTFGLFEK